MGSLRRSARALRRRLLVGLGDRLPALRRAAGEKALLDRYRATFGHALDVRAPTGFTAKLFVAMIANNRSCDRRLIRLTDKYRVRAFVAGRIGEQYLVRLLWSGAHPGDIPFDRLPPAFVAKTNHGCGMVVPVDGVLDQGALVGQLSGWLAGNYFWHAHEAQYHAIAPLVLIEEYVGLELDAGLVTLRCWCFDGTVELIQVDGSTAGVTSFYDTDWRQLDLDYRPDRRRADFARPARLADVIALAARLAAGFAFVRVDIYVAGDRILFNEMTFTPAAGRLLFSPPHWDRTLGDKWPPSPVIAF